MCTRLTYASESLRLLIFGLYGAVLINLLTYLLTYISGPSNTIGLVRNLFNARRIPHNSAGRWDIIAFATALDLFFTYEQSGRTYWPK